MNSIKVNGSKDIELVRTTLRPDVGREPEPTPLVPAEPVQTPATSEGIRDVIKVSDRATTVRSLVEQAGLLPEVRGERVEQFRLLIQTSAYFPAAATIADALLGNA